jgi:hypothetical protein
VIQSAGHGLLPDGAVADVENESRPLFLPFQE